MCQPVRKGASELDASVGGGGGRVLVIDKTHNEMQRS